jgi:hypothetical protein
MIKYKLTWAYNTVVQTRRFYCSFLIVFIGENFLHGSSHKNFEHHRGLILWITGSNRLGGCTESKEWWGIWNICLNLHLFPCPFVSSLTVTTTKRLHPLSFIVAMTLFVPSVNMVSPTSEVLPPNPTITASISFSNTLR